MNSTVKINNFWVEFFSDATRSTIVLKHLGVRLDFAKLLHNMYLSLYRAYVSMHLEKSRIDLYPGTQARTLCHNHPNHQFQIKNNKLDRSKPQVYASVQIEGA